MTPDKPRPPRPLRAAAPPPETPYEQVPYRARPCPDSHPSRLAAVARLLGLEAPPVETCRVLELACGDGSNLIAIAASLPGASCYGLDLSPRHIAEGTAEAAALGLKNVALRQRDVLDIDLEGDELGEYDYILAHGFYSWVPRPVQDRLLAICRRHLTQTGLAFVSYNINPGWRIHSVLRDFMLMHTRGLTDPAARVAGAQAAIELLSQATAGSSNEMVQFLGTYARIFKGHIEALGGARRESALLYDSLFEFNSPVYFSQFVNHAARNGLKYVAEADFQMAMLDRFPEPVAQTLALSAGSHLDLEQYADFTRMKMFRQSVLCHAERAPSAILDAAQLCGLHIAGRARPEPADAATGLVKLTAPSGAALTTDHALTQAAIGALSDAWPRALPFESLVNEARARLGQPPLPAEALQRGLRDDGAEGIEGLGEAPEIDADGAPGADDAPGTDDADDAAPAAVAAEEAATLGVNLLRAYAHGGGLLRIGAFPPAVATEPGERPTALPYARRQAQTGDEVTSAYHENFTLEPTSLALLPLLDGTRDRAALLQAVRAQLPGVTADELERHLRGLAGLALLVPAAG